MTSEERGDELLDRALASLAACTPDTARAEPIRAKCRDVLARRRRRPPALSAAETRRAPWWLLEPVFASILATLFLREAMLHALVLVSR